MQKTPEQILHQLNSSQHTIDIVESSARLIRRRTGAALGNAEQKIGAYLTRVENISENPALRERLASHAVSTMLTKHDDVPQHHWDHLWQMARNEGMDVNKNETHRLIANLHELQRTDLTEWFAYFQEMDEFYPTWFKVYALQGVAKMGLFDKEEGVYQRRSRGTVATFPPLNYEALAHTYEAIGSMYGNREEKLDDEAAYIAVTGNFAKVYSHFVLETKQSIPIPERVEDVDGEWVTYAESDIPKIASAATGTGWCIANQSMAASYINRGDHFHFYHLKDIETGRLSNTAAASIRISSGQVAEVSGLRQNQGQALDDVLLETVAEKVFSLPGGERYYSAIIDKRKLIEMDEKFQSGQPFTVEELRFLYEIDRPIDSLNHRQDIRITDFKEQRTLHLSQLSEEYGREVAEAMILSAQDITRQPPKYWADMGISIDMIAQKVASNNNDSNWYLARHISSFLELGVNPDFLASRVKGSVIVEHAEEFVSAGANIDEQTIVDYFDQRYIPVENRLRAAHVLDLFGLPGDLVLKGMGLKDIRLWAGSLLKAGIPADQIAHLLKPEHQASLIEPLMTGGADIDVDALTKRLRVSSIAHHLPKLLKYGASIDIEEFMMKLSPEQKLKNIRSLREADVEVDIAKELNTLSKTRRRQIRQWLRINHIT